MSFFISTPTSRNAYKLKLDGNVPCVDFISTVINQERIISPLDIASLQAQNKAFKTEVVDKITSGIILARAMTFSRKELELLIKSADTTCEYIRVYCGIESDHFTQFILPVDSSLNPILDSDIVCISDLPCPPKTGCPSDAIVNA